MSKAKLKAMTPTAKVQKKYPHANFPTYFKSKSFELIFITLILTSFGLILIYSSSSVHAFQTVRDPFYFLKKQLVACSIGFSLVAILYFVPIKWLKRSTLPVYFLSVFLLILTTIPALSSHVKGASRWLNLGLVNFQPGELAKLAIVLVMSKSLSRPKIQSTKNYPILSSFFFFIFLAIPLMLQPDFGTTLVIFFIIYILLFCANLPTKYIAITSAAAAVVAVTAIISSPYRLNRILSFLDPWANVQKSGFQIIQSYLGFKNGGLLGLGVGESKQKLYFLPEAHNDFIVSVIGEEFGLFGVWFVIICFIFILNTGYKIFLKQNSTYNRYLALGCTSVISLQACFNLGVTLGLLPTKGISLPFVSSGASSLMIFLVLIGILSRLDRNEV